ncbi:MAG: tripartite tricarboxylate transporter substrate binding protein, partial [Burkholderiales bacterium]
MIQKTIARAVAAGVCGLAIAAAGPAIGAYPEKPVRLIVPFSTGGGTDIQARLLSQKMREDLRQQVLV